MEENKDILNENSEGKKNYTLNDFLYVLLKYKKHISIVMIAILLLSVFYAFFVVEHIYFSNAIVKASEKPTGLENLLSGGGLIDIGEFGELAGTGSGASELALFEQILTSRTCIEELILKFNLLNEYNYVYMYDAVKFVTNEVVQVTRNRLSNTLSIGIYYKNPQTAKDMADFLINYLNKTYTELNVLNAKNNREFLEKRYNEAKIDLTKAEDSLKMYQERYGVSPELKIKSAFQTQMQIEATVISEEVKLDLLKKILSPDQSEVKEQENKIASLKSKLTEMKSNPSEDYDLALNGAPEILTGFLRLQRNVEIQNKILITLIPLLEQSKLKEKKDTPSLLIIDNPNVPDKKAKPKRVLIVGAAVFIGFIITYFYLFIYTFIYGRIKIVKQRVVKSTN